MADAEPIIPLGIEVPKTRGWRPEWHNLTAAELDLPDHARAEVSNRFGLSIEVGNLDRLSNEGLHNGNIPLTYGTGSMTPRWINAVRGAIENLKHRFPAFKPHVDLPRLPEINYALLGEAIAFYKKLGYTYIEAPWAVSDKTVAITCPNPQFSGEVAHMGSLVGSAEQSFLHLDLQRKLGTGKFVACTPCFRIGDEEGEHHFPTFMKVELYQNGEANMVDLLRMIADAGACFRELGADPADLGCPSTDDGWDITLNDLEIGSYGARTHTLEDGSYHFWLYGTGLALPRFEQALEGTPPR